MDQSASALIMVLVLVAVCVIGFAMAQSKVETQAVDADEAWAKLSGVGNFQLTFYRQSGNVHRVVQVAGSRADVEDEIRKVFNRAGIRDQYMVGIRGNQIDYCRAFHNHRGSNEGKKVGGCLVSAL
ncbi:hypothetical protein [Aeromonas veronii]|uniref:hypothetical protein n=1 Tax=Aeromonas veronii TaxID=654 RepID=UPI003B9EEF39